MIKFYKNTRKLLITSFIFLFLFLAFTSRSPLLKADGDTTGQPAIGIDPAIIESVLDENQPVISKITLSNLSNLALPIKTLKQSFSLNDKTSIPQDKLEIYDASSWITLSDKDTDFILQPKENKIITLNITQPKNASPGGHYATLYFQPLIPAELTSQKSVYVYARAAVLVLLQVKGDIVESLKIKDFSTDKIYENGPININLTLQNDGNTHLLPTGKVNIYDDLTGNLISSMDLNNTLNLPGLDKVLSFSVDPKFVVGKISAEAVLNFGSSNRVLESNRIYVIIFPFKTASVIFVLLLIFILLRKRIYRAFVIFFGINQKQEFKLNTNLVKRNLLKRLFHRG